MNESKDINEKRDFISLSVPRKPEYVSVARLTVSSIASRLGFNIEEIEDIKVALAEACINVIKSGTSIKDKNIELEFYLLKDQLCIIVKDKEKEMCNEGKGKLNIEETKEEDNLRMSIIKALMDDVECINNEEVTELKMIKRIGVGH